MTTRLVRGFARILVLLLIPLTVAQAGPARADTSITPVRQMGGPGHAELYGWGAATFPDGTVAVGDYWNYRVQHYATNGTLLGTIVPKNSSLPHGAPYGLAVDPVTGDLYMGDPDRGATVDKYTMMGAPILEFGSPGTGPNRFQYPRGVAVASDRTVFVADARDNTISAHTPTGVEIDSYSGTQSPNPRGIAVDATDRVYVADSALRRVQVFDSSLTYLFGFGSGQLGGDLRGVAVDKEAGWLYVVDAATSRVYKYTLGGQFLLSFGSYGTGSGQFSGGGRDITVDGDGNVWVGDMPNYRVQKFAPDGTFLFSRPSPPAPPPHGGFAEPRDVTVDGAGNVFVADTHNWRVQKFSAPGQFQIAWGTRGDGAYGFNYPKGIAVDRSSGAVYVCDTDHGKVKKYTNSGTHIWTSPVFIKCYGGAVDAAGNFYAADGNAPRVVLLSGASGALLRTVATGGTGPGRVQLPTDIAVDPDGSIWVSDRQRNDVQHFSATGQYLGTIGAGNLAQAWGVAATTTSVLVADSGANQVKVFAKSGTLVMAYGGGGTAPGRFQAIKGIDYHNGLLYTIEQTGERVQVFSVTDGGPPPPNDTTAPNGTVTVPSPNQAFTASPIVLSGTATDNVAVDTVQTAVRDKGTLLWWNGSGWQSNFVWLPTVLGSRGEPTTDWSYVFDPPSSAGYIMGLRAIDTSGNIDPTKPWVSFTLDDGPPPPPTDTTPPDGLVTVPVPNQVFTQTPVALTGTATDNVAIASVDLAVRNRTTLQWWNGSSWQPNFVWLPASLTDPGESTTEWSYSFDPPDPDQYLVGVRAIDTSGNTDPSRPWVSFATDEGSGPPPTDTAPPDASVAEPTPNQVFSTTPVTLSGSATDDVAVASVEVAIRNRTTQQWWNGSGWQTAFLWLSADLSIPEGAATGWTYTFAAPGPDQYVLGVRAIDTSGNVDPTKPWVRFSVA